MVVAGARLVFLDDSSQLFAQGRLFLVEEKTFELGKQIGERVRDRFVLLEQGRDCGCRALLRRIRLRTRLLPGELADIVVLRLRQRRLVQEVNEGLFWFLARGSRACLLLIFVDVDVLGLDLEEGWVLLLLLRLAIVFF